MVRIRVHVRILGSDLQARVLRPGLWTLIYLGLLKRGARSKVMVSTVWMDLLVFDGVLE